ncbi:O-methyltransferase [Bacillaceae bacterium W0354]
MERSSKKYIQALYKEEEELILTLEKSAKTNKVPIMEKDGVEFLKQLIRIYRPKQILEIGTAIGYSAIQMAKASPDSFIKTIEIDENRFNEAVRNIKMAQLDHRIEVILADASQYIEQLSQEYVFDFVFIDAAKGQYKSYVEKISPFIKSNGLIVIDNVLFKGYVAGVNDDQPRLKKIGQKIDDFNKWLIENKAYDTTFVETGDGIAISIKK